MSKIKIIVACHKADSNICTNEPYFPIQVGKTLHPELDLGFQNDNEGDNISEKNSCWSELTALYWGWKNIKDVDYLGLCHYRRYFDYDINSDSIDGILNKSDIIVVKQNDVMVSKRERPRNLIEVTSLEDYYIYIDIMISTYPEYRKEIIDYFYNSRESYPYTMFVAKKEIYDDFCKFIFPVFFRIENIVKPHGYTRQKRMMGYLGECSLGLYIHCKHLKPLALPLKFADKSNNSSNKLMIRRIFKKIIRLNFSIIESFIPTPQTVFVPDAVRVGLKSDNIELKSI